MFRRVHRPGGEISNRTTNEQKKFRDDLVSELNVHFSAFKCRIPFCCVTLNGFWSTSLGNNEIYRKIVIESIEENLSGTHFDSQMFWGRTNVEAHHIIPLSSRYDSKASNEPHNGILINSYLHELLHQLHQKGKNVGLNLIRLVESIYLQICDCKDKIGLPDGFCESWGNLLVEKRLISRNKVNKQVSNKRERDSGK